jgi:hypothetical protein
VDAERASVALQGRRLIGKGAADLQHGEYLQLPLGVP